MTAGQAVALQAAIYTRLVAELADAAPGGGPVAVFDHVPDNSDTLHVRLEAFSILPVRTKNTVPARHRWTVRAFDEKGAARRGQSTIKALVAAVIAALEGWRPIAGAGPIRCIGADVSQEDGGPGFEAACRFDVQL